MVIPALSPEQTLWGAVGALVLAGLVAATVIAVPNRRLSADRRLQLVRVDENGLTKTTRRTTDLISRAMRDSTWGEKATHALDRAGIRRSAPELILMVGAALLAIISLAGLAGRLGLGILASLLLLTGTAGYVFVRSERRRQAFAGQLDDLSQLLATNLRAGHSLLQSLSALAGDLEEPASSELHRAVNQVRVGRDLGEALDETARRMASEDFTWIGQAIAINRQVGGNLADVLDTVSFTIRERNQVRRQVRALSAEGRLSAVILMGLPMVVGVAMVLINPMYLATFTQSLAGFVMIGLIGVMMLLGGFWLWRIVQVKY